VVVHGGGGKDAIGRYGGGKDAIGRDGGEQILIGGEEAAGWRWRRRCQRRAGTLVIIGGRICLLLENKKKLQFQHLGKNTMG
jgi:hypothetical protein